MTTSSLSVFDLTITERSHSVIGPSLPWAAADTNLVVVPKRCLISLIACVFYMCLTLWGHSMLITMCTILFGHDTT